MEVATTPVMSIDRGRRQEDKEAGELVEAIEKLGCEIPRKLIQRLLLLNKRPIIPGETRPEKDVQHGSHLRHSLNVGMIITEIFHKLDFSELDRVTLMAAAILHDIGKTGPAGAGVGPQRAIMQLFAFYEAPGSRPLAGSTVGDVLKKHFYTREKGEEELRAVLLDLETINIVPTMTMREVYNRHLGDTHSLLEESGVHPEIVFISSSHHTANGDAGHSYRTLNIKHYVDPKREESVMRMAGVLELVDSYEASRQRAGVSHIDAVNSLKKRFGDTPIVQKVISALDESLDNINAILSPTGSITEK